MRQRLLSLGSAITLSVCIHIAAASLLLGPPRKGAQEFGSGGIAVSLGPAGREPGGKQTAVGKADTRNSEAAAIENSETASTVQPADTVPVETTEVFETYETEPPDVSKLAEASENTVVLPLKYSENPEDEPVDVAALSEAEEVKVVAAVKAFEVSIAQPDDTVTPLKTLEVPEPESVGATHTAKVLEARPAEAATPTKSQIVQEAGEPHPIIVEAVERAKAEELRPKAVSAAKTKVKPPPAPPVPKHRPRPPVGERTEVRSDEAAQPADKAPVAENTAEGEERPQQSASLMAGQGGRSGTAGQSETGSGDDTPGGGTPGAAADYYTQLQAWLEKHKRYPRRAKLRNEQGVALLRFVVTRAGEVTDFGIEKSTGYSLLDEEVREMIQRAQPLPKMPPEMHESRIELLVPVQFFLR